MILLLCLALLSLCNGQVQADTAPVMYMEADVAPCGSAATMHDARRRAWPHCGTAASASTSTRVPGIHQACTWSVAKT